MMRRSNQGNACTDRAAARGSMGCVELTHQVGVRRPNGDGPMQPLYVSAQRAVVHTLLLSYLIFRSVYAAPAGDCASSPDTAFQLAGSPGR